MSTRGDKIFYAVMIPLVILAMVMIGYGIGLWVALSIERDRVANDCAKVNAIVVERATGGFACVEEVPR